ncbi:sodium:proton antiporter [Mesorhizobium sp. BR1-1-16]|uniref:cation:proton antiporter n=1 Tax=Mesorhizobium sp. BR1-1-16 TaxID=2876653 RepID=UPI001CCD6A1A|nr:sodium:proton antiporter [Mesorhizobium sp. BR1-1-16]MBZ9937040.1 sodium:proton antiporter [Mesorhizobium sp. BR1-1-16]
MLLTATAVFAWLNHVYFGLPHTIGLMIMGLVSSLLLIAGELLVPDVHLYEDLTSIIRHIDFQHIVLDGMLAFLLFAGALHVDFSRLRNRAWSVGAMATIGVVISTAIVGTSLWLLAPLLGLPIPFIWALVFGVLISPTDPVAVLAILKTVKVPASLEIDMSGESLFNDGVAVVLFSVLLAAATGAGELAPLPVAEMLLTETLGGALIGLGAGYIAYRASRRIDDYVIEVLISIALAMGAFALASRVDASGPIAVVLAGLYLGNRGPMDALSEETQRYLFGHWTLVDQILNSILFLLIGLEVLVLRFDGGHVLLALGLIPVVVAARLLATSLPVLVLRRWQSFAPGSIAILTWGGLRGGISIALALSLPETPEKAMLLTATYCAVIFTIAVQGLTLKRVIRHYCGGSSEPSPEPRAG